MKLHDRLDALRLLWEVNDLVVVQTTGKARTDIQDRLQELRRIVERQQRQGTPR